MSRETHNLPTGQSTLSYFGKTTRRKVDRRYCSEYEEILPQDIKDAKPGFQLHKMEEDASVGNVDRGSLDGRAAFGRVLLGRSLGKLAKEYVDMRGFAPKNYTCDVYKENESRNRPIVVHCSAGIGRTGTFVGLEYANERLKSNEKLGLSDIMKELRQHRLQSIQSHLQYLYLSNMDPPELPETDTPEHPEIKLDGYDDEESIQQMKKYFSQLSTARDCEIATVNKNAAALFGDLQRRLCLIDLQMRHMNQIEEDMKYLQNENVKLQDDINHWMEENDMLKAKLSKYENVQTDSGYQNNNNQLKPSIPDSKVPNLISTAMNEVHQIVQNLPGSSSTMPVLTPVSKIRMKFDNNDVESVGSGKKRCHTFR
uniref:Protein tyrosine phosphatase n=1 Tax=Panagrolaimus sp. JU765 TaxID=591449 RepID=A0AC34R5U1_9BILA